MDPNITLQCQSPASRGSCQQRVKLARPRSANSPTSTTFSSPNSISSQWNPSGSPRRTRRKVQGLPHPPTRLRRLEEISRSSSSSTAARKATLETLVGLSVERLNYLAANGYVVVMVIFRGSTGYGQAFVDAINNDWGGKPFTDLMTDLKLRRAALPLYRQEPLSAPSAQATADTWPTGSSATPNRFKCIVTHDGMFNAESAFGSTEEDWFNIWEFRGHPWDYYGKPDSKNPFRKWSPVALTPRASKRPRLFSTRSSDYRLDVSEAASSSSTRLQLLGTSPAKCFTSPTRGHWILKPQNSQLWYKTVNDWVNQWTRKPIEVAVSY